jgi:hypothetical protein
MNLDTQDDDDEAFVYPTPYNERLHEVLDGTPASFNKLHSTAPDEEASSDTPLPSIVSSL